MNNTGGAGLFGRRMEPLHSTFTLWVEANIDICNMKILIVAATSLEIQPAINLLQTQQFHIEKKEFSVLVAGIGGIATTYNLTRSLHAKRPDYIIQAGVAGSFRPEFPPGSVVCVREELMGDLGAEEGNTFNDVFDLDLVEAHAFPFSEKMLKNPDLEPGKKGGLSMVRSITINEITTRKERIDLILQKYKPDIESMEGAAFHYVCLQENIPFLQIRAVSNYVGERNKGNWKLSSAIENLNKNIIAIVNLFSSC
jgi:futalosine hydrolase